MYQKLTKHKYEITLFLNDNIPKAFRNDYRTEEKQRKTIKIIEFIQGGTIDKLMEGCKKI